MEAGSRLQFEKVPKVYNRPENGSAQVFAISAITNVLIVGGSRGFPYCGYCVLAGTKKRTHQAELEGKAKTGTRSQAPGTGQVTS